MRVFIFGIGGTGARVLRSFAMVLASGVKFNDPSLEIIPVIIDMDAHNGDTARTRETFRNYYAIRKAFIEPTVTAASDSFFNAKIRSFTHLDGDASDLDLQLDFQDQNNTFADFIHFNGLKQLDKSVLELMYNDMVPRPEQAIKTEFSELNLNLGVGFKGNPNIGSVVFNDLKESQQFKNLVSSYTSNDRIFIISSIFGGTGSAGFPTLVKLIRHSGNPDLARTKLGAITVMPYFNVETNDTSAINSALFNTKTKAALSYYANDSDLKSVNALYYIADIDKAGTLPNVEGGKEQINNGHLIELIAATAIVDFINRPNADLELDLKEGRCYEFGAESDANPFTIKHFNDQTKEEIIKPLVKLAFAAQIATKFVPKLKDTTFYGPKELNIDAGINIPSEYNKLLTFFKEFKKWSSEEMNSPGNGRSFNAFNYEGADNLNNLIYGKEKVVQLTERKIGESLNVFLSKEPADEYKPYKYLKILSNTAKECLTITGQLP